MEITEKHYRLGSARTDLTVPSDQRHSQRDTEAVLSNNGVSFETLQARRFRILWTITEMEVLVFH